MIFLLDANVLIDADRDYYPLDRVPQFWDWLLHLARTEQVKVPIEVLEEVLAGKGPLVEWVKEHRRELVWEHEAMPEDVRRVVDKGYASDLREDELVKLGKDPFLVAHALGAGGIATVATTEVSKPRAQRANRRLPDVCKTFGLSCIDTFELTRRLNFGTDWQRRAPSRSQR